MRYIKCLLNKLHWYKVKGHDLGQCVTTLNSTVGKMLLSLKYDWGKKNIHLLTDWGWDYGSSCSCYSFTPCSFSRRKNGGSDTPTTDHQAHNPSYSGLPGPWTFWPWHWPGWVEHMTETALNKHISLLLWILHPLVMKPVITMPCTSAGMPTCLLCVCLRGSVYCDDADLTKIPPLPKDTTHFYARFNKITAVKAKDFLNLSKMVILSISVQSVLCTST